MAKGDRQRRRSKGRNNKRKQPPVSTKVSITQLVTEGLLRPGHTIVCNTWPFTSTVSKHGTFDANWATIPEGFHMPNNSSSIMKRHFETPSAWATAVCRLMRAQQQNDRETTPRVAVNGWTACRVRIPRDDPNRILAERLLEAHGDNGRKKSSQADDSTVFGEGEGEAVEVPLDLLRRELLDKETRQTKPNKHQDQAFRSSEILEISGLAKRVESDLALGSSEGSADLKDRKRKGGSDTSRHKKLSRVPSDDTMSNGGVSEETQRCLDAFQKAASALDAAPGELKALRYQRKRQLRNMLTSSVYTWLQQRRRQREKHQLANYSGPTEETLPDPAEVRIPWSIETRQHGLRLWCAACGSSGKEYLKCHACGDHYHPFCTSIPPYLENGPFLCTNCRICVKCFSPSKTKTKTKTKTDQIQPMLQCDDCGLCTHIKCTNQGSDHSGGLQGEVLETRRWLCDTCIRCLECGQTASTSSETIWTNDFTMCRPCAQQMEKGKVCPECLATYSSCQIAPNMVCCDICGFWIHVKCDARLTPGIYDALITLEDAPYVCVACSRYDDLSSSARMLSVYSSDSDGFEGLEPIAGLPRCLKPLTLRTVRDWSASSLVAYLPPLLTNGGERGVLESEAEAANLLLSLTRSDVRFEQERFDVERLEEQFCGQPLFSYSVDGRCHQQSTEGDRRECGLCGLCGLHGDGREQGQMSLGRLVPIIGGGWVHVECLAWARGPKAADGESPRVVKFEGEPVDMSCALCGRAGASVCCCAPASCSGTAYHLPCLLLAGEPSVKEELASPWYCLQRRRALCAQHASEFSATLTSEDAVETTTSFDNVRIDACVDQLSDMPCLATRVGNLIISEDQGFSCLRYFELGGQPHTLGIEARQDEDKTSGGFVWQGWLVPGLHVEKDEDVDVLASTSLPLLLSLLFEARKQQIKIKRWPPRSEFLMNVAAAKPSRFLGVSLTRYQENISCIPKPTNQ